MRFELLSSRRQLAEMMTRIYTQGLTTTSGGNLSIKNKNGDIWITPAGIDKALLTPDDMVCLREDGTLEGKHRPSSELPFHRHIYDIRPDIGALVHAHPPALVAFSIVGQLPETRITPQSQAICGQVTYAPYATPGTDALGANIAQAFALGSNSVMLENHGVVTGGANLLEAFQRFETLEFCARINLQARALGGVTSLSDEQVQAFIRHETDLAEFTPDRHSDAELDQRHAICEFVRRAYTRRLMISTGGTVSVRLDDAHFLITPSGADRYYLEPQDVVLIEQGRREAGKTPSRAVRLHQAIYTAHPTVNCIMHAQPPHATTYSLVLSRFDTRTIPESYILLREMPIAPYGSLYEPAKIAALVSPSTPVILLQNDAVLAIGATLLEAFDRLEVAEFSAQALIDSHRLGELAPIGDEDIEKLKQRFKLT
jgi:L-fuculose-phosphate aldolase